MRAWLNSPRMLVVLSSALVAGAVGCGETEINPIATGGTGAGTPDPPAEGGRDVTTVTGPASSSTGEGGQDACNGFEVPSQHPIRPVDVLFVVDNSAAMADQIAALEQNINPNFAQVLDGAGVDHQVVMLTSHGASPSEVCVPPPLSGATASCTANPGDVPGQFHHYSIAMSSEDSLCRLLDTYFGIYDGINDDLGLHLEGWSKWLRTGAHKVFVQLTNNRLNCSWRGEWFDDHDDADPSSATSLAAQAAEDWDKYLLLRGPGQFGTVARRNYQFFTFVGLAEPMPNPLVGHGPDAPLVTGSCNGASSAGFGYQWLSLATGARRYPVCRDESYDAMFQALAANVVDGARDRCALEVATTDPYEPDDILVEYGPGGFGERERFERVVSLPACGVDDQAFYYDGDIVRLCPAACDRVRADGDASLRLMLRCPDVPE